VTPRRMPCHQVRWTREMDEALLRLRGRVHANECARRVGVSNQVMYRRLRELQQPIRPCDRSGRHDNVR
jgi:hypothetical protein